MSSPLEPPPTDVPPVVPPVAPPGPATTADAVRAVTEDVRRLVRAEIGLAKAEVGQQLASRAGAIGMLVAAAVLGLYALYWLTYAVFAGWRALAPTWAAALLTVLVLLVLAGALVAVAVAILRRPMTGPERAVEAARETQTVVARSLKR